MTRVFRRGGALVVAALVLALTASVASADGPGWETVSQDFNGFLFGLNTGRGDELLVADSSAGPTLLDPDDGDKTLIASLPGVSDVIQVGRREYMVLTSEELGGAKSALYRVKNGNVTLVADILEWELAHDFDQSGNVPGQDAISNPFDLAKLSRNKTLVADAGGNSIHVVDKNGNIEWVATLPYENLFTPGGDCPADPPDFCSDPVATTVAVGPDGAIYAGELKGVPATPGTSRVWRIEPDAREVRCGTDDDECTQVDTGPLTSISDIQFDGQTAYVVEIDEASWLAAEGGGTPGGTVNACLTGNGRGGNGDGDNERHRNDRDDDDNDNGNGNGGVTWSCEAISTGLPFPLAVAIEDESVYVTLHHGFEGPFEVAQLTGTDDGGGDEDDDD